MPAGFTHDGCQPVRVIGISGRRRYRVVHWMPTLTAGKRGSSQTNFQLSIQTCNSPFLSCLFTRNRGDNFMVDILLLLYRVLAYVMYVVIIQGRSLCHVFGGSTGSHLFSSKNKTDGFTSADQRRTHSNHG